MNKPIRPIKIIGSVASCNGSFTLGHPLVYLHLDDTKKTVCPYCSQEFINETSISLN